MSDVHGRARRSTAVASLIAALTAVAAVLAMGIGNAGSVNAAPRGGPGAAKAVSNDLVKIKPAKVRGTWTDPDTGRAGRIIAKFTPGEFVENDGSVAVTGTLSGLVTGKRPAGTPRLFSEEVTMAVLDATSPGDATTSAFRTAAFVPASSHGCDILTLDLGPLFLDLLGLQIDLAPVNLDITAVPGAGNLLGNLLCAVAGLLDPGSALGDLLDNLLGALNGLLTGLLDLQGALDDLLGGLTGGLATQTRSV